MIRELLDSFGDELRYVWRSLPLNDVHPNAQMAAEAAEAAAAPGAFWEMHDGLLGSSGRADAAGPRRLAEKSASTSSAFGTSSGAASMPRVADDVASADSGGVAGTPTLHQRKAPPGGLRHRDASPTQCRRRDTERC